jgi:hypothetical protein
MDLVPPRVQEGMEFLARQMAAGADYLHSDGPGRCFGSIIVPIPYPLLQTWQPFRIICTRDKDLH